MCNAQSGQIGSEGADVFQSWTKSCSGRQIKVRVPSEVRISEI